MGTSNSMVAHKWAHSQAAKGSNFSTDGSKLYSYNTLVGFNTGRGLVFISADSMTSSTGKQLGYARRAVSHLHVVASPVFRYGHGGWGEFNEKEAFQAAGEQLNALLTELAGAKNSKYLAARTDHALDAMNDLNTIARQYSFDEFIYTSTVTDRLPGARAYALQYEAKDAERRERARVNAYNREQQQREKDAAQFQAWLAGDDVRRPSSYRNDADGGYYLTVRGDKVITSGGAECPVEHAVKGLQFWLGRFSHFTAPGASGVVYERYIAWQKNGHRVQLGTFQLDKIDAQGNAFAGCHKFTVTELRRFAGVLVTAGVMTP